jgi:high-affinity iron transporter
MFGTSIIVFREVLEAALIIGIIAAASREVPERNRWIIFGLVLGLMGAGIVAASTEVIASLANGVGQELFNALVLGIAVVMLAWHSIWMKSHGAELAKQARNIGHNIRDGQTQASILLAVVGLAVLREGSETVLFLYGIAAAGGSSALSMLLGGLIGTLLATLLGFIIYKGLLRIPMRWFFSATSVLIMALAAGMASQAAKFLIQADKLPSLGNVLWDTSNFMSEQSMMGMLFHSLIGYEARPAGLQVLFYIATLVIISVGMSVTNRKSTPFKLKGTVLNA